MQSAQYLRSQAELCLEVARQLSNPQDVKRLRARAAEYLTRALDAEVASDPSKAAPKRGQS
jgi:hypothetical protein